MKTTRLADGLGWPEGPALLPDGRVIFVEAYRSRISVWAPGREVESFAVVGGGPNAVIPGHDGALYVTQNGGVVGPWRAPEQRPPSIQRVSPTGKVEILATSIDGRALRAPNDLAFGPDGSLYFTDPGGPYDPVNRPDGGFIYVLRPDGSGELLVELPPVYPNGIAVEADGSVVWVESYTKAVKRWTADGKVTLLCTLPEKSVPDGFKIAANGDLYITGVTAAGLDIIRRDGSYAGFLPVGVIPTNCAFAGRTLYVTDGGHQGLSTGADMAGHLWSVELAEAEGAPLFPGQIAAPAPGV
jgi:gluconolactonase